jgi:DNA repair exonuclease SbcCD nuclease subunit
MIKFGYFTDTHARFDTPEERTDNFLLSLLTKLEEVGQIFKDNKVDYVLFGGDLYDSDSVAKSVITSIQTVLRSWQLPIIGVVGSHDYFGYQMKTLKSTALGITESAGIIDIIGGYAHPQSTQIMQNGEMIVTIVGTPHTYTFADSYKNMYADDFDASSSNFMIQIVHGDLNDKPVPWRHILIADELTCADLVLSGHYHPGWDKPIIKRSCIEGRNTTFINPGSISRMKNTGVVRTPRVCIISVEGDKFTNEFIKLTTAIPHPFKEKKDAVEDEEPMPDIAKFFEIINKDRENIGVVDVKGQLLLVADKLSYDEEVIENAMLYLDRASGAETETETEES